MNNHNRTTSNLDFARTHNAHATVAVAHEERHVPANVLQNPPGHAVSSSGKKQSTRDDRTAHDARLQTHALEASELRRRRFCRISATADTSTVLSDPPAKTPLGSESGDAADRPVAYILFPPSIYIFEGVRSLKIWAAWGTALETYVRTSCCERRRSLAQQQQQRRDGAWLCHSTICQLRSTQAGRRNFGRWGLGESTSASA